jgi:hypothetical protein
MNDELGRMKDEFVSYFGYYSSIVLEQLKKITANLSMNSASGPRIDPGNFRISRKRFTQPAVTVVKGNYVRNN